MSSEGPIGTAVRRVRGFFCPTILGLTLLAGSAWAAEADSAVLDAPTPARQLQDKGVRQADALAHFMTGLFEEESAGPEKAIESKRQVLALDPACTDLAIELSYEYLRRGEIAEATNVLKDTITAAPTVTGPYLALATIYLRHLQKPDLAVKYAQKALEVSPRTFEPYEMLWEIYETSGQSTKASQVLEKAAKSKSRDPRFWLALAEMYGGSVREGTPTPPDVLAKINRYLEEAAPLAGRDHEVEARIGDLYGITGQEEKAIPFYKKVVEAKPGYPKIRERLASCYISLGRNAEAIEQTEALVVQNPLNLLAYQQLSQLYLKEGNFSKALVNARQCLIIEPGNFDRHTLVIGLLERLKRYGDMADALGEARQQFPRVARITHLYANALSKAKRHDEALRAFAEAQVEYSNSQPEFLDGDFYFDYGAAAEQGGQYARAEQFFRRSIELNPSDAARAYNYLGYMWVDRGERLDEASRLIEKAVGLESSNGAFVDSLGWLYYKQGKYPEALTELLRAASLLPEPDSVVFDHIGDTYNKLGKSAEAVLYWQKSLQLDPENKQVVAKLDKAAEKVAQQPDKKAANQ